MKFIAKKKAFYNDSILLPGDSFEADPDFVSAWAVKAEVYKPEEEVSPEKLQEEAVEGLQGKKKPAKKKAKKKASKG